MKYFLLAILVLLSCSSPLGESQEELQARCMPVLENIVRIQNIRDIARKDFEITISDYAEGKISEESWQIERRVWLDRESSLAGEVNQLYIYSYRTKCLE